MLVWDEENKFKNAENVLVDTSHVVAKGSKKDILDLVEMWSYDINKNEDMIKITLDENSMEKYVDGKTKRNDITKFGNSYISNEYLLNIMEEILGKKIIAKSKFRPMKKWWGRTINIAYIGSEAKDVPIIITNGNNDWYVVAPVMVYEE